MRYYLIAGEASGDMHAANLMEQIKRFDEQFEFRFWGGDRMEKQGGTNVKHYKHHAFMGFAEVLMNIRTIAANLKKCKKDLLEYQPELLVLVDYPGFNLRIAEFAHEHGIKVAYYISPQIWAWKENRIHKIKRVVDEMFVILPFEKDFYKKHQMDVHFVGHPLLDELQKRNRNFDEAAFRKENGLDERPIIALLPGSRTQEIQRMLPVMIEVISDFPDYQFVIAGTKHMPQELYNGIIGDQDVKLLVEKTYPLLQSAYAGMITSGTASLETALFHVPQLVMYKAQEVSYQIARRLVKLDFVSVANLVFKKEVFREFIQRDCKAEMVSAELKKLIKDSDYRASMLQSYQLLDEKLGGTGASERAARVMVKMIS